MNCCEMISRVTPVMLDLVERMLSLHKQLASAKTGHPKTVVQRQIGATDRQIDRLVYELYGLTDEEIAIMEEATNGYASGVVEMESGQRGAGISSRATCTTRDQRQE